MMLLAYKSAIYLLTEMKSINYLSRTQWHLNIFYSRKVILKYHTIYIYSLMLLSVSVSYYYSIL